MIPCSGFIEEVLSVDADANADDTNSARTSHRPPFRRVTKYEGAIQRVCTLTPQCYMIGVMI